MSKKLLRLFALLIALGLFAAACGDDATEVADDLANTADDTADDMTDSDDDMTGDTDGDMADDTDGDMSGDPATVVDIALSDENFSILVAAVTEAGLVETLQGDGPFTVFAPTNAAFEALIAELGVTAEDLLARDDLADILTYHVVGATIMAEDAIAADGTDVATVNGASIAVSVVDGAVMVDDATVTTADLVAGNGVVHVIDAVILPG